MGQHAVGYIGWVGHGNLGDEAVYEAIQKSTDFGEPLIPFIAAEGESMLHKFRLGGCEIFRAVLFGGGTLIHPYYLPSGRLAHKLRIPLYTVGTGVGSPGFFTPERPSLDGWKEVLQDCELLSVRGPLSHKRLLGLGLTQVETIGDPALGLAPDTPPAYRSRQRLIINLVHEERPVSGSTEYAMLSEVAMIANDFADKGGELIGVALARRDRVALEQFKRDHRVHRLAIEDRHTSVAGLFNTLAGSIALIGIRLHSAVLASCVGVPSILFAYRDKCKDFMASMDVEDLAVDVSSNRGPRQIRGSFERLQSDSTLGAAIYAKARSWKETQQVFYEKLAVSITNLRTSSQRKHEPR